MEGKQGCIRCFAVGPVCPNKSVTMYYVFRKYKRDSTFRVSGVLQLAKTGPPVTKHCPLLCLVPSDAMMAWRLYTPSDVNRTNLHVLTARGMSHILTWIGQLWSSRKKIVRASPKPKLKNYESVQHRLQLSGIKKGAKISFHRHFKQVNQVFNNMMQIDFSLNSLAFKIQCNLHFGFASLFSVLHLVLSLLCSL